MPHRQHNQDHQRTPIAHANTTQNDISQHKRIPSRHWLAMNASSSKEHDQPSAAEVPRSVILLPMNKDGASVAIDRADCEVIKEIVCYKRARGEEPSPSQIRSLAQTRPGDPDGRVWRVRSTTDYSILRLPESLGKLDHPRELDLSFSNLRRLPESLGELGNLTHLFLRNCHLRALPGSLGNLAELRHLDLANSSLGCLPESIGNLTNLEFLDLSCTRFASAESRNPHIQSLPDSIGGLRKLQTLKASNASLEVLPDSFGELKCLEHLDLRSTHVRDLPEFFANLRNLRHLDLRSSRVDFLPGWIGELRGLEHLDLSRLWRLMELPDEIGNLVNLQRLVLEDSSLQVLPRSIGKLQNLQVLNVSASRYLIALPDEIGELEHLRVLDLAGDQELMVLPPSIAKLQHLETLDLCGTKRLKQLPDDIGSLANLRTLTLWNAGIASLPASIGRMPQLQCLALDGTRMNIPAIQNGTATHNDPETYLTILARACPRLGHLGRRTETVGQKLRHALAHNRARFRTNHGPTVWNTPGLWPRLLVAARCAFEPYRSGHNRSDYYLSQPDAVYRLLVNDGRESFVGVLLERQNHIRAKPSLLER